MSFLLYFIAAVATLTLFFFIADLGGVYTPMAYALLMLIVFFAFHGVQDFRVEKKKPRRK